MMKFRLLFYSLILTASVGFSQAVVNDAFQAGEMLRFTGSYYMSSLWADLAEVKIDVTELTADGKSLYSIKATASSYSNFDNFFKIRDLYQTWVDKKEIKPYIFKRHVDEGGYVFNMKYIIKRNLLQAKYEHERKGVIKNSVIQIKENTQDLVSVMYYIRTLDYEKMTLKQTIPVSVLIDDKIDNIILTYKGKETVKTEALGSKVCYKLGISINNKALVNKETNNMWLTADKNKIPVQFKAEIPVGSVQLRLVEAKGIKQ